MSTADVLAGRHKPGPRALVEMITEVNPTGRDLAPAEQARRYAEKSALQSLLVRWYGESFRAVAEDHDDVVLLRHRHFEECACHARLSSLDDAARRWVWESLAEDAPPCERLASPTTTPRGRDPRKPDPAEPSSGAGLLARAEAALAEYDYEQTEALASLALDASGGAFAPARLLLELLVDRLGQDDRAIALEPRLSASARAHADVRVLLGIAAARAGDVERALTIARGLEHTRAGEVWAAAGHAALRAGDVARARRCAGEARAFGASSEAAALEGSVDEAVRARAANEEKRLEALSAEGRSPEAEALAHAMLANGLPSARAQKIVREAAARRADEHAATLERDALEALDAGDLPGAKRAWGELARSARRDTALEARLERASREARAAKDDEAVRAVLDALSAGPRDGAERYLALPPSLRAQVRERGPASLCELADRAAAVVGRGAPVAVERILALEHALESDELDHALALATSVPRALASIPRARRALDETLHRRTRRSAEDAVRRVEGAVAALAAGDWDRAASLVEPIEADGLALVENGEDAVRRVRALAQRGRVCAASVRAAEQPGADLAALHEGRAAARDLAEIPTAADEESRSAWASRWSEVAQDFENRIAVALRFEEHAVPERTHVDLEDESAELGAHAPEVRIDHEGHVWFIASPEERCWITEAAWPELRVTRRFSFSPSGCRRGQSVIPIGDTLWIPLSEGGMIVLDRRDPRSLLDVWWGGGEEGKAIDDCQTSVAPDGRMVARWLGGALRHSPELVSVSRSSAPRPLDHCAGVAFFGSAERARVLVVGGARRAWSVRSTDGAPIAGPERWTGAYERLVPVAVTSDPVGDGHLVLAVDSTSFEGREGDEPPAHAALDLVRTTADFEPIARARVAERCALARAWLYVLADHAIVVHHQGQHAVIELLDSATLALVGTLHTIPGLTVPLSDASGRCLRFVERSSESFRATNEPTTLSDDAATVPFTSVVVSPRSYCAQSPDAWAGMLYRDQLDLGVLAAVTARRDRARRLTIAESSRSLSSFTGRGLERLTAEFLLHVSWQEPAPDGAALFCQGAEHAVSLLGGPPEVLLRLERAVAMYTGATRAHVMHLLGLAHLASGQRDAALQLWREASSIETECPLTYLLAVVGDERDRARPQLRETPVAEHARRYAEATASMACLDAALAAGRGEEAWAHAKSVRALVGPSWQLSARIAALHLDHPDPSTDPWRLQLDLSWMASGAWLGPARNHMIFTGCHWDHVRLTEISERAAAAIDALGLGPAHRPELGPLDDASDDEAASSMESSDFGGA